MVLIWGAIGFFLIAGVVLIIWRNEFTSLQARTFGARLHPGCAVVEGVAFILFALIYYLVYRAGLLG